MRKEDTPEALKSLFHNHIIEMGVQIRAGGRAAMPMSRWKKIVLGCLTGLVVVVGGMYGKYRYEYPYGRTHCCTIGMWFDLRAYAESHEGRFPTGESTPEASLSLLYKAEHSLPDWLAGRAKSGEVAKKILESGGLLGPQTCDWHYVEGLTWDDDDQIAILWDKSSLGHTGYRLNGGHEVLRLRGLPEVIRADKWKEFLAEQAQLLAQRSPWAKEGRPVLTAKVQMPDGTFTDSSKGGGSWVYRALHEGGRCNGWFSGSRLCWYYPHADNDLVSYDLTYSDLVSERLWVKWHNGLPEQPTITFHMH